MRECLELACGVDFDFVAGGELGVELCDHIVANHHLSVLEVVFYRGAFALGHGGNEEVEQLGGQALVGSVGLNIVGAEDAGLRAGFGSKGFLCHYFFFLAVVRFAFAGAASASLTIFIASSYDSVSGFLSPRGSL